MQSQWSYLFSNQTNEEPEEVYKNIAELYSAYGRDAYSYWMWLSNKQSSKNNMYMK